MDGGRPWRDRHADFLGGLKYYHRVSLGQDGLQKHTAWSLNSAKMPNYLISARECHFRRAGRKSQQF
jgi:hypothetical protein